MARNLHQERVEGGFELAMEQLTERYPNPSTRHGFVYLFEFEGSATSPKQPNDYYVGKLVSSPAANDEHTLLVRAIRYHNDAQTGSSYQRQGTCPRLAKKGGLYKRIRETGGLFTRRGGYNGWTMAVLERGIEERFLAAYALKHLLERTSPKGYLGSSLNSKLPFAADVTNKDRQQRLIMAQVFQCTICPCDSDGRRPRVKYASWNKHKKSTAHLTAAFHAGLIQSASWPTKDEELRAIHASRARVEECGAAVDASIGAEALGNRVGETGVEMATLATCKAAERVPTSVGMVDDSQLANEVSPTDDLASANSLQLTEASPGLGQCIDLSFDFERLQWPGVSFDAQAGSPNGGQLFE